MGEIGDPARPGGRAFVGRDREVAELAVALEDAAGGRGCLLLVAGEPGIGKTWLAEHLAGRALQRGIRVLWGRCWEGGGAPPFWPWAQIIGTLVEGCDDETLAAYLGAGAASIAQVVPGLTERLGTTAISPACSLESDAARLSVQVDHWVLHRSVIGAADAAHPRRSARGRRSLDAAAQVPRRTAPGSLALRGDGRNNPPGD